METARRIAPDFAWKPPPVRSSLLGAAAVMLQSILVWPDRATWAAYQKYFVPGIAF